ALESTRRKLEAAEAVRAAAQKGVADAERALADSRKEAADAATSLAAIARGVWAATKTTLADADVVRDSGVLDAIGDAVDGTDELRSRLDALRSRPAPLIGDLGWGRSIIFAALVLAVPPLVAWLVGTLLQGDLPVQLLSSATATLSVIAVWARSATGAVAKVD